MRKFIVAVTVLAFVALGSLAFGAEKLVTLTMTERVGVAREGEWITIGVPLPKGKVKSTDELVVLRGGKPIPAEILSVNKWWDDGSLRWVHLIFQGNCAAKGKAEVTLARGGKAPAPKETVAVKELPDRFVVDTGGALVFQVLKKRFNVIDVAWVGGEFVFDGQDRGLGVNVEGKEYLASLDPDVKVKVEEQGPLHAVLRASGSFKNRAGEKKFDFDCRLYAYAGSPDVKVVVAITNRQGALPEFIPLDGLFLELPTTVKKGTCLFGTDAGGIKKGSLATAKEAYVYQVSSSEHVFGGAVSGKGVGKQTKPDTIGWGALSDGKKGIAAGIKWFWQMAPKSVELTADGLLRVGLYAARHKEPLKIYTGVARTHELRLSFQEGRPNEKRLQAAFAGLQKPLRPFAPARWYCRDTQALGDFVEAGGAKLYGPYAEKVKAFDDAFESANRSCQNFRDSRTKSGVTRDSYGFLGFGDGVHHVWTPNVSVAENIAWDGNYYGYPHMMCVQFMRTGNIEYFDNFEAHALHVADVHTVHWTDRKELVGACRYCPPTDHVRVDPTKSSDYKTAPVYVSDSFCHHKVAGVIERWYFLRDHRSLDVANLILDHTYRYANPGADNNFGQPRAPGMIMEFCYQAYMLTGDKKWIPRGAQVLHIHRGRDLRLSFQAGIFCEGMRRYYEMSGDPEAFAYLKKSVDRMLARGMHNGVDAQAYSFMYLKTGDKKYLDAALSAFPTRGQFGNPWKNYALAMRSAAMCIADLYHAAQGKASAVTTVPAPAAIVPPAPPRELPKISKELILKPTRDARITGHPSEADFNSGGATRMRARNVKSSSVEIFIIDFDRNLIKAFLDKHAGKKLSAKVVLTVREVQNGPGKLELATVDSSVDWVEGTLQQKTANRGDCTFRQAQAQLKPWTTPAGQPASNLRELFYDMATGKVKTTLNSNAADVSTGMKTVSITLDEKFLKHLATNRDCRGIALFTRDSQPLLDFFSREQSKKEPRLVLVVSEAE